MKLKEYANILIARGKRLTHPQILVIGFASLILLGAILLMLPVSTVNGAGASVSEAFFTATSAVCVTGLVVVDTGTYWSFFGQIVILILIQVGALGFMSMATMLFLITGKKISVKSRMLIRTSFSVDSLEGIVRYVKYVVMFTLIVEVCGAVLLSGVFIPAYGLKQGIFMSVFHSISAFCNAGFDIIGNGVSFMPFATNILLNIVVCLLIIIGGIGFAVVMDLISKRKFGQFDLNTKVVLIATGVLIALGFVVVLIGEYNNPETIGDMPFFGKILASLFTSVTPRTAGFNTIDMASLRGSTKMLVMLFMFVGGSPGSTAGGVKTTTFSIFFIAMLRTIQGHDDMTVFQRRLSNRMLKKAIAIFFLGILWIVLAAMLLNAFESAPAGDILFEVMSAFGTVGLSTGITASLGVASRIVLILTMFFGRVGLMTVAFAINRKNEARSTMGTFKYPDGNLLL